MAPPQREPALMERAYAAGSSPESHRTQSDTGFPGQKPKRGGSRLLSHMTCCCNVLSLRLDLHIFADMIYHLYDYNVPQCFKYNIYIYIFFYCISLSPQWWGISLGSLLQKAAYIITAACHFLWGMSCYVISNLCSQNWCSGTFQGLLWHQQPAFLHTWNIYIELINH